MFQLTDDSSQLITFINIEPVVTIADGITQPTIVTVIGSDGKVRKLIFKVNYLADNIFYLRSVHKIINLYKTF